ncbi:hypothetical protein D5W64_13325 [Salmonella enterica subsp. enterica serovar Saintpaul]|nr:hypothetical protein [Salmonella enterica subsp. enterica serovar Saintpaul]
MSIRSLKDMIFALNKTEEFSFPHHLKDGKFSLEDTLARLEIVETQHFPIKPSMDSIGTNFCHAVQERYGSHIIDMAKELIYRHGIPEETICDAINLACINNNIVLESKRVFLSGTPSLPRGCTGEANAKSIEHIKRYFASFRSMKNKLTTRISRKRAILALLRSAQYEQEKLLSAILSPGAIGILAGSSTGWKDLEALFKDMQNKVTQNQNKLIESTNEMAAAMKEMHKEPKEKPIHFLGRDHYQAMVFEPVSSSIKAQNYVWKMIDTAYPDDKARKHAFQTVMSYIHRLSTEHQKAIIRSMKITETDPRQVGIQITKLLEEKIMGNKEPAVSKETKKPDIVIEFPPKYLGHPFNPTNTVLTNPKVALHIFLTMFREGVVSYTQITTDVKAICTFFMLASNEVKHELITRVYRLEYKDLTPIDIGRSIIQISTRWLEQSYNAKVFDQRNLEDSKMFNMSGVQPAQTVTIVDGDYPNMAAELERMFVNAGMNVDRPQASYTAMAPGYNHTSSLFGNSASLFANIPDTSYERRQFEEKILNLVNAQMALMTPFESAAHEKTIRDELIKKAMEQYKPKLQVINREQQVIYRFEGLDVNGELFTTISLIYTPNGSDAVYHYQHVSNGIVGKIAHIQCTAEVAVAIFEELKRAYRDGCQDMRHVVHHAAQSTASKIYS